jgi:RNA polymerase subunit RPABC4/transcription elongation factor Spt4
MSRGRPPMFRCKDVGIVAVGCVGPIVYNSIRMAPKLTSCRCCGAYVSEEAQTCPKCGQPQPGLGATREWESEARLLVAQGKKINAIKLVREATGFGLREAKDLVESWEHR